MHSQPRVSIITPSYNQARYLEETIGSVLDQKYPNIEYWVIDGGSTDGSVEIIKQYAPKLAGWVSEKDLGQADGINKGFARATGEIVAWLNSDDLYYPGAITDVVEAFDRHPEASFVFSDVASIDADGKVFNIMHYGDWKLRDLMTFKIIGQPGVFMRREVLEKAGYLDLSYNYLLDVQLWMKLASLAEPYYIPGAVWAAARSHAEAKNTAQAAGFGPEAFRLAYWLGSDERFAPLSARDLNKIWAGAYRLDAFYKVEAGDFKGALGAYRQMLRNQRSVPLKTLRRMLFALAGSLGQAKTRGAYNKLRQEYYQRTNNDKNSMQHDKPAKS